MELNNVKGNQASLETKLKQLVQMVKAGPVLTQKAGNAQASNYKAKCPIILDITKLTNLTNESTKKQYYDFIINFYEEREMIVDKETEKREKKMVIKKYISEENANNLSNAFKVIGYYEVGKSIQSGAKNLFSSFKQKMEE